MSMDLYFLSLPPVYSAGFLIDDYRFGNFVDNCVAFFILLIFLHALTNLVDGIVRLKGHKKFWKLTMIPLFIMEGYVDE
ncbi:MAG: hypothetical protein ACLTZB_02385 [Streptococcus salivarius]